MVKCVAPSRDGGSWRGSRIEIADDLSCELTVEGLAEMRAHGFREWTDEDEIAGDKADGKDPADMSRKELLGLLKGKGAGNITLMGTDELRGLAMKVLAGESIERKEPPKNAEGLRTDGPTLAEFVKAGYRAENYPPHGYAAKPDEGAPATTDEAKIEPSVPADRDDANSEADQPSSADGGQ